MINLNKKYVKQKDYNGMTLMLKVINYILGIIVIAIHNLVLDAFEGSTTARLIPFLMDIINIA